MRILIFALLFISASLNAQTYGWMISSDPAISKDTQNVPDMYPTGNGNLSGRMHFVSYETMLNKLIAYSPDTVYINTGDSLVIVSIHGDTTYFAGGGGISNGDKGDITVSSGGAVWTIDNGLAATKIADGSVTNSEFQYLGSVTSDIQTQLNNKAASGANTDINSVALDNTGLRVKNGTKKLTIQPQGTITADRTIGIDVADANRILTLGGDLEVITGGAQVSGVNTGDQDLSGYSLDANVVHKTGDETINGEKTFNDSLRVDDYALFKGLSGGIATKIEMLKEGILQFDQEDGMTDKYIIQIKPLQDESRNVDFLMSQTTTHFSGSRDDNVFYMGWNLGTGGGAAESGKGALGLSFEDFYNPAGTAAHSEFHLIHIDTLGVSRRPLSAFMNVGSTSTWSFTFGYPKIRFSTADDVNAPFFEFTNPNSGTQASMKMLNPVTSKGMELLCDPDNNNVQWTNLSMSNPTLYSTQFTWVEQPKTRIIGDEGTPVEIVGRNADGWVAELGTGWGLDISGGTLLVDSSQVATQYDLNTISSNVSDGDKGDITVSGSGATWNIDDNAVGAAEIATDGVGSAEIAAGSVDASELASTTVAAGTYFGGSYTVDADGRLTAVASDYTISPTQITSDQDNYNPTAFGKAKYIRISSDNGMRAITSMVDSTGGEHTKVITNIGSYMLYFPMDHPDGTAANRFTGNSGDIYLFPGQTREFYYDATSSRWRCVNYTMDEQRLQLYYDASARSTATGDNADLTFTAIGTGSAGNTAPSSPRPGYIQLSTASSGTAGYILSFVKNANTYTTFGDAHIFMDAQLFFPTLSDGTETYTGEVQISSSGTSTTLEPNNTIGVRYSNGINSGKWELFTQSNTGTEATADLGVTVAANTVYKIRIEADKANAEARAYINGAYAGKVAINVNAVACTGRCIMLKSAGTTARTMNVVRMTSGAIYPY